MGCSDSLKNFRAAAVNLHRQFSFEDKSLRLFAMTPEGESLKLERATGWRMYRKDDPKNFPEHPFVFELVQADDLTDEIKMSVATVKIDEQKFKIRPPQSVLSNLGVWRFRAQAI